MNRRVSGVLALLFVSAVGGCATPATPQDAVRTATAKDNAALHTDLIQSMIEQRQYFAALAHIDAAQKRSGATPELRLLRAECFRKTNQGGLAEAEYRDLLSSPVAGKASHGLGLLLAERDLSAALPHLQRAVRLRPTDALIRNDLGYGWMLAGQYGAARVELATAAELAPDDVKPRNNLIVLLLISGQQQQAQAMQARAGLDESARQQLADRARTIAARVARSRTRGNRT